MNTNLKNLLSILTSIIECAKKMSAELYKVEVKRDNNKTALTVDPITIFLISISLVKLRKS